MASLHPAHPFGSVQQWEGVEKCGEYKENMGESGETSLRILQGRLLGFIETSKTKHEVGAGGLLGLGLN